MVKEFTNPLKEPIDDDINLFDFLDRRAQRDPDGSTVEYKGETAAGSPFMPRRNSATWSSTLAKGLIGLGVKKGDAVSNRVAYALGMDRARHGHHGGRGAHRPGLRDEFRQLR